MEPTLVGDGIQDDRAAIQAMIDAAPAEGTVYLPPTMEALVEKSRMARIEKLERELWRTQERARKDADEVRYIRSVLAAAITVAGGEITIPDQMIEDAKPWDVVFSRNPRAQAMVFQYQPRSDADRLPSLRPPEDTR